MLTSNAVPGSEWYMLQFLLYYQEMVEIQSKNRFLSTFLGVFGFHPLTPYELRPNFLPNERYHWDASSWKVSSLYHFWLSSYRLSNVSIGAESTIFGCFLMVFQGLLPQMKSDSYKIFTSDAAQDNASYILRFFIKC